MIIPSIDISEGRAVQLRRGRKLVLEGGDPLERLAEFSVAGEVAVIDLDAARGMGSNAGLIREMVRRAPCRVGGGIRSVDGAQDWLDAGAARVIIGTAASVDFCKQLPRERVIAAVDAEHGEVVVEGWETATGVPVLEQIDELAPVVGGFLFTQVEHEGGMAGFDWELVEAAVAAAGDARVTAAGGITSTDDIARLHALGADAQVGMALYSGTLSLGEAVAAPLVKPIGGNPAGSLRVPAELDGPGNPAEQVPAELDGPGLWPTVVVDEAGKTLGLVWSTRGSVAAAVDVRRGIYWSRSRNELWEKGATSGATQELLRVDLDCDADALRFTVRQHGPGFCHTGDRGCWDTPFSLHSLDRVIEERVANPLQGSGTAALLADPELLAAKITEEAAELNGAADRSEVVQEAADLLYFTLTRIRSAGGTLADVEAELRRRSGRVRRRPMTEKEPT